MLEEIRIGSLGVIESSSLELGPGLTVITGETGAGKTMIVTALGLLLLPAALWGLRLTSHPDVFDQPDDEVDTSESRSPLHHEG